MAGQPTPQNNASPLRSKGLYKGLLTIGFP